MGFETSDSAVALVGMDGFALLAAAVIDGELHQLVETTATVVGCLACGTRALSKGRRRVPVRDLPAEPGGARRCVDSHSRHFPAGAAWRTCPAGEESAHASRGATVSALRRLQSTVRAPDPPDAAHGRGGRVPDDLRGNAFQWLELTIDEAVALDSAILAVATDLSLEHLGERAAEMLWRMVCEAIVERRTDHVGRFLTAHSRDPESLSVFFTIRHLDVRERFNLAGVTFLPLSDPGVPAPDDLLLEPHVGGVARAEALGTNRARIVDRARSNAEHALRVLRVGLPSALKLAASRQFRFRLGERYAFEDSRRAGWQIADDAAWEIGIDASTAAQVASTPMGRLSARPASTVERHAATALRWADRAVLTPDPLVRLLYLFFALEALVGDRAAAEKGRRITFRRAMLDHAITGGFHNPHVTYALYDDVRSAAVHGDDPPEITADEVYALDTDVRSGISEVLEFAASIETSKHSQVIHALDTHPDALGLLDWLQKTDRWDVWSDFEP